MTRSTKSRGSRRGGNSRAPMNVRIVPESEGTRAMKVERQLAAVKESQAQVRVVCKTSFNVGTSGSSTTGNFSFPNLRGLADFVAMEANYEKYRVTCFRFDIVDFNPGVATSGLWGTYHGDVAPTSAEVVELSDVTNVPPGTGKASLYWYPSGPLENSWYDVTTSGTNPNPDFGGLAYFVGSTSASKWNVVVNAIVDFRART